MKSIFLIFLISLNCFAEGYDYKKYWTDSGLIKTGSDEAFGVEIKTSPLFPEVPIATISYTKNNKESKDKILSLLKKVVNSSQWSFDEMDGLEIYETYSRDTGTIYRLAYNDQNHEFSLASIAVRYILPTYLEAHLIQIKQLKTQKVSPKKFSYFMSIFLQNANAQSFSFPPIDTSQLTTAIGSLGPGMSSLGKGLTEVSTEMKTVGSNLATAGNNTAGSINNLAGSINNTTDSVKGLVAPANVARTAAIAGAAFGIANTLSSMATNFLVNGTMSMLRTLYYEAAGELKPEEKEARLKRFETSMKSFAELSPKLSELSAKMATTSIEITFASGVPQEQYLLNIDQEIEKARKAKNDAASSSAECQTAANSQITQLENLKNIVRATGNRTREDLQKSCEKMDELYNEWVNAEYTMLNSRRLILQDLLLFNGQIVENSQQQDVLQEDRKKINSCKSTSNKILKEILSQTDVAKCTQDDANMSLLICRRYFAQSQILANCDIMASTQLNEEQKVELDEATARLSSSLTQFSKSLAAMSCEKNAASCSKAQMDIARAEVAESFKSVAEQCPDRNFAKTMKKSMALKAPVVNIPKPQDNRNFLQRIFGGSENPNRNVARDSFLNN